MKNILKYTAASAAMILSLSACEELPDYQTTIDAAPKLAYVNPQAGDTFESLVVHRPVGSTGDLYAEFQVHANTTSHPEIGVEIAYDADLVAGYNESHGTSYAVLPEEYLDIENASLVISENANVSADTVKVRLSETADLSRLTERAYLAPLKVVSDGLGVSEDRGNLWFIVNTEINLIRPVTSVDEMVGFPAGGTSAWTADCDNYANLFDGSNSTSVSFSTSQTNVLTIDMKKETMVTGLKLNTYQIGSLSVEYSEDGNEWKQAGAPVEGEYLYNGSSWSAGDYYVAVYDYITARYLRLSFKMGYYARVNDISVYMIESTEPTVYAACGTDNTFYGKITHHSIAGSIVSLGASFNVMTTVSSASGYGIGAEVSTSLVSAYNSKNGTNYSALDASYVEISGTPCQIAAGANKSDGTISVFVKGDVSSLKEKDGYLIPVQLKAPAGAVVSAGKGVVYVVLDVEESNEAFMSGFAPSSIAGNLVTDRSGWNIEGDEDNLYEGAYADLLDGNDETYVSTNYGPLSFTVDLGKEYDMTGLVLTEESGGYWVTMPESVKIEVSLDNGTYETLGTATKGTLVVSKPSSYVALYGSRKVRYIRIEAVYDWNSTAEFNIYVK